MVVPSPLQITLEDAHNILKQFDCANPASDIAADSETIRQSVLLVAQHSDYQILGICADTIDEGRLALETYAKALDYAPQLAPSSLDGPVYIKFNPKTGLCYADSYLGHYRGVLVSCQSAYESGVNTMYGHLPLNLFATSL
ncbi:MAG TPA: DUF1824 family protein [Crinalium sp.]|jgi:hypothetical protein